jgi:hypothetical protein
VVDSTFNNANGGQPIFQQFLKASTDPVYSISQINSYPTTTPAVQVVTTLIYACTCPSTLYSPLNLLFLGSPGHFGIY